jgi:penicillin-binding protein A
VLVVVGVLALVVGVVVGSRAGGGDQRVAREFARAWERTDYRLMYGLLSSDSQSRYRFASFKRAYTQAARTATGTLPVVGKVTGASGGRQRIPLRFTTRVFGSVAGDVSLPVSDEHVDWNPSLVFPGLSKGERLSRQTKVPPRGKLLTRDGKVIAQGPPDARMSPLGPSGDAIAGRVEAPKGTAARRFLDARGFPRDTKVGVTGLERTFESQLAGRPGGELRAGRHVIARAPVRPARTVRTTIDSRLQAAAVTALGARLGGVAALDPRTGELRALAGVAYSAPQPPGSTFKLVTTTAALEAHLVKPSTQFPVETKAVIDGVDLENANGESCGGTFQASFAKSCNSVFAPLGVKVGAKRLVAAAERYGFNDPPAVVGEAPSTLPKAGDIDSPLAVGSTAIGQGKVLATPLRMVTIAQTIASGGVRLQPTLRPVSRSAPSARVRVTSRHVAATIERFMIDVVKYGTGTSAAIPGVVVAGKTGTAELADTRGPDAQQAPQGDVGSNTDAWFTSFAPAGNPRIAVAVLAVRAGAGGQTAAPIAKQVLLAGLKR